VLGKAAAFKGSDVLYSAGDRIELVRYLSNADPLKLGGASFEAQKRKTRATERFWPSSPSDVRLVSVYHRPGRRHDVFLPFPSFSALTVSLIMMDSFEYASLILIPCSISLFPQLGLLHPRRSPLMGRSLSPRLARSPRWLRLDLIPHIRARNRESPSPRLPFRP
jgi:hypothetical protein